MFPTGVGTEVIAIGSTSVESNKAKAFTRGAPMTVIKTTGKITVERFQKLIAARL